jgi:hypothetical protein
MTLSPASCALAKKWQFLSHDPLKENRPVGHLEPLLSLKIWVVSQCPTV